MMGVIMMTIVTIMTARTVMMMVLMVLQESVVILAALLQTPTWLRAAVGGPRGTDNSAWSKLHKLLVPSAPRRTVNDSNLFVFWEYGWKGTPFVEGSGFLHIEILHMKSFRYLSIIWSFQASTYPTGVQDSSLKQRKISTTAFPRKERLCIAWLGHLFASRTCPLFWLGPNKIHESLVPLVDTILPSTSWKCHACDWADFIIKQDDQKGGPLGRIVWFEIRADKNAGDFLHFQVAKLLAGCEWNLTRCGNFLGVGAKFSSGRVDIELI